MGKDAEGIFRTHAQYIRAFAHIAGFTKPGEAPGYRLRVVAKSANEAPSSQVNRRKELDNAQVRSSLANAWGTELLLALSGKTPLKTNSSGSVTAGALSRRTTRSITLRRR